MISSVLTRKSFCVCGCVSVVPCFYTCRQASPGTRHKTWCKTRADLDEKDIRSRHVDTIPFRGGAELTLALKGGRIENFYPFLPSFTSFFKYFNA